MLLIQGGQGRKDPVRELLTVGIDRNSDLTVDIQCFRHAIYLNTHKSKWLERLCFQETFPP